MKNTSSVRRKEGYIRSTKGQVYPELLLFLDTESYIKFVDVMQDSLPLRLGVAIFVKLDKSGKIKDRKVHEFKTIDEYFDILKEHSRKGKVLYVFAHNCRHDVRVLNLPEEYYNRGFVTDYPIMSERLFIWDTRLYDTRVSYIDTSNFAVQSVGQLGKDLGYDKLTIDFETVSDTDLFVYCKRDVEILERFIISYITFLRDNNLGSFCSTLASQSLRAWRQRFMPRSVFIHNHQSAINLERESYSGGRVECFYIGKLNNVPLFHLDINSMYPYVMLNSKIPCKLISYSPHANLEVLQRSLEARFTIAHVLIDTPEPAYPHHTTGKLLFPIGQFHAYLAQGELEYALVNHHIKEVYELASYDYAPLFSEYVNFFYNIKQQATENNNLSWRLVSKIFMNALYGKFGQTGVNRKIIGHDTSVKVFRTTFYNTKTGEQYQEIIWYGDVIEETKGGEATYSFPAIAAAITSYARILLWQYVVKAGRKNVYYVDTDSLIVNELGYSRLNEHISATSLGMLKLEKESDTLEIFGNKDYRFGDITKVKGVPKSALLLDKSTWMYMQFEGFYSWLHRGGIGAPLGTYMFKQRKTSYDKGQVAEDGNVTPWTFNEEP